jgi:hypothetical protein
MIVVLVIRLDGLQPIEDLELDGRRQELRRRPQQGAVVGVAAKAA